MISMRGAAMFAVCVSAFLPGFTLADEYPSRAIKVVIPFAAGGGGDIAVRVLTDALAKKLGQGVVIENRPGPYGMAAAQSVKAAEPDGYSMVVLGNIHAIGQTMMKSVAYDVVNDFVPIVAFAYADVAVFTSPKSSLSNLKDVIERAKATQNTFNIGSGLVGTTQYLTATLFKSTAQLSVPIVSFRASAELATAVMRGDVAIGFELIPAILGSLESGSLKPIAVSSGARFPRLPQTSTFTESGLGTSVTSWAIFAAPARHSNADHRTAQQRSRRNSLRPGSPKQIPTNGLHFWRRDTARRQAPARQRDRSLEIGYRSGQPAERMNPSN